MVGIRIERKGFPVTQRCMEDEISTAQRAHEPLINSSCCALHQSTELRAASPTRFPTDLKDRMMVTAWIEPVSKTR